MTLSESTRIPQEVVARQIGDEVVMLHLSTGTYYSLDPVAARVWQLLEQGKALDDICDIIVQEYDVPRATVERDVLALVDELSERGLIAAA